MKKQIVTLFYFSGTGNTWWVSERIVEGLRSRGFDTMAYSIEQVDKKEAAILVKQSAIVGLGFPIYGSDVPKNFHTFIKALPTQKKLKSVLGYVTQWAWSGDGANFLAKELFNKGYEIRWAVEFNMFNNIALPVFPALYTADHNKFKPKLEKCRMQVEALCEKVVKDESYRQHSGHLDAALGWIQRGPFRMAHDWGRKFWSVDREACTACERCARICPVGNISMVNGIAVHSDQCVYCMRCLNYCPTYAVHYMGMSNKRLFKKPPFQGPVPTFQPELIAGNNRSTSLRSEKL